jgi:hypothetical protein
MREETEPAGPETVRYCSATTQAGKPCHQFVSLNSSGLCIHHDPARSEEARRMRKVSAERRSRREPLPTDEPPPPPPDSMDGLVASHQWIAGALARGQLKRPEASALVYNLSQLRLVLASRDLEDEVKELRKQLALLQRQAGKTR